MTFSRLSSSIAAHLAIFSVATVACATVAQAKSILSSSKDSTVVRNDPVIIVDGNRVSQDAFTKLQNDTVQVEVLRGKATVPFGDDAEGGVIRITTRNSPAATGNSSVSSSSNQDQGSGMGGSGSMGGSMSGMGNMSGMGGMGDMSGMGGGGMGGMSGNGQVSSRSGGMNSGGGSAPAAASSGPPIYPITIVSGSRITDNDLFKVKVKMTARIEVLDPDAATAKYGKDASAGAISIMPLKEASKPKPSKSSKGTSKKGSAAAG